MMTEIETIEAGQKDVSSLEETKIEKKYIFATVFKVVSNMAFLAWHRG